MNDLHPPTTNPRSEDHMDDLLRGFFRAEMPDPWPAMTAPAGPVPSPTRAPNRPITPPRQRWFRMGARLALAASIGFILVAYLALARHFPQVNSERPAVTPELPDIGHKQPLRVKTPRGQDALLWEDNLDSERIIIKLEMVHPPKRPTGQPGPR